MAHALTLAKRGTGSVSPNPRVGCVIVADNNILAEGWHAKFGGPHAEVAALQAFAATHNQVAPTLPSNATVYVTLEPCSHVHKTPPCVDALLAAGAQHVVVGMVDPYQPVNGKGIAKLRDHGVRVEVGVLEEECAWVNRTFIKYVTTNLPYVVLKMAQSIDGFVAPLDRTQRAITGPESRRTVHALRAEFDSVLVGIGTALADDPQLTVRDVAGRNPTRIVLDRKCVLPVTSNLVQTADSIPTIVACDVSNAAVNPAWVADMKSHGVRVMEVDDVAPLPSMLSQLASLGIASVLCEGGARLAASLMGQGFVDEVHVHVAPITMGDGLTWTSKTALKTWRLKSVERVGNDVHLLLLPPTL